MTIWTKIKGLFTPPVIEAPRYIEDLKSWRDINDRVQLLKQRKKKHSNTLAKLRSYEGILKGMGYVNKPRS